MELSIAKLFLEFRETSLHQISKLSAMLYAHDHQLRALQSEINHLKHLLKKYNDENNFIDNEDIPF